MGRADYLRLGSWNAICDRCGKKFKNEDLSRTWDGKMVCRNDWEPRHPQDYVRPGRPEGNIPWSRPEVEPPSILYVCSIQTISALPNVAAADCGVCDYVSPNFDATLADSICSFAGSSALPDLATPDCFTPDFVSPYL